VQDLTTGGPKKGLNTNQHILDIEKDQSPNMMDVAIDFNGSPSKRMGSNTQNSTIISDSAAAAFSPNATNLTNNLIAYWKLNEASGTRFDSYGGNHLTDFGGVGQTGGIKNQAANFILGNSSFLLINNTATLATGDIDFSISTWIYLNSTARTLEVPIVSKRDYSQPYGGVDSSVVLMLHMNGSDGSTTFTDESYYSKSVLANGDAQVDSAQFKFGNGSCLFDGTGDFLTLTSSNNFDFGTADFTIDTWVRYNSLTQQYRDLLDIGDGGNISGIRLEYDATVGNYTVYINGSFFNFANSSIVNTWSHVALVRSSNSIYLFVDGNSQGTVTAIGNPNIVGNSAGMIIGTNSSRIYQIDGWMDELRVTKGVARWVSNFTTPTIEYNKANNYEYYLYLNTDNIVNFKASSSGRYEEGSVQASSFGALNTATWYNIVAWHDTGNFLGLSVNNVANSASYSLGLRAGSAPFVLGTVSNGNVNYFDGRMDETSFYKKVLTASNRTEIYNAGSGNTINEAFDNKPWASYDFGASGVRWLTVSAGTAIYASSNLGVSFVTIATDRSSTYQWLQRSKNVLVATSDRYDTPLYWSGSSGTFMARLNSNATATKYSINFNGFLILLNSQLRPRGFFYEDENTQLTGTWASNFDIPSTQDDEITCAFILRRYLYVSTKYFLYRVNYVGGNPDFSYIQIKDWGFVPRTVRPLYIDGVGQIVIGMSYDKKLRLFDGSDDKIISNPIEEYNGQCDFSLDNVSIAGSGLILSFAETDINSNVYKLCVAIGADSKQTTHFINFDGRSQAFYPYANMNFNTMVMAESGGARYLMAFDRIGYCHMMDSGNLDGNTTPINDYMDSSLKYEKSPSQTHKGHATDLYFANLSCGTVYYFDRIDFSNDWKLREKFVISGSDNVLMYHKVIDIPETYNTYQFRLSSSSGTNDPWSLSREDHFMQGLGIGKNN